jgi:hypothetical protein
MTAVTINLSPALNPETKHPIGAVLKPSNSLIRATGREVTVKEVYVKVTPTRTLQKQPQCTGCFLRDLNYPHKCSGIFSCLRPEGELILQPCNETGETE